MRPQSFGGFFDFVVQNSYELNGNRTNIVYPGGLSVAYFYDEENRLESVTTEYAENTESFSFGYDNAGRVTGMSYPNGVNSTFGYDAESRITGYSYNNGSNFVQRSITRDPRGFKTSDDIIQGLEPAFMEGEQRREHNAADQLTHIDQRDTWLGGAVDQWYNRDYSYNDNGCLIEEDVNRPEWNTNSAIHEYTIDYEYDYDNRLKSVVGGLPYSSIEYLCDASGVRIARIDGGTTNYFVIDYNAPLKMPLAEADAQGNITRYYIWSSHGLLAHMDVNPSTGAITSTRYYHSDEQNSTLALSDETGAVTDEFAYTPYGVATHTGSSDTPYTWLGGIAVRAEGNGLYYMLNRYYSAPMRRFISSDPAGIDGGENLYAYANLAPTHFTDPYGLCAESHQFSIASVSALIGIAGEIDVGVIWDNVGDGGLYVRFSGGIGVGGGIDSTLLDLIAKGVNAIPSSEGAIRDQRGVSDWYAKAHFIGGVTQNIETQETKPSIAIEAGGGVLRDNTFVIPLW